MKKTIAVILSIIIVTCVFAGCNKTPDTEQTQTTENNEWNEGVFNKYGLEKITNPAIIQSFGFHVDDSYFDTEFVVTEKDAEALIKDIFSKAIAGGEVTSVIKPDTKVKTLNDVKRTFEDGSYQYIFEYMANSKKHIASISCMPTISETNEKCVDVIIIIEQMQPIQ